jgi:hypothetical protein
VETTFSVIGPPMPADVLIGITPPERDPRICAAGV